MNRKRISLLPCACFAMLIVFILDSKTCAIGAADGLTLCIKTVIPSLLPMMVLSSVISQAQILKPMWLSRLLGVPNGAESFFISGVLGGYPVGAKCIAEAYHSKKLSHEDAAHLLCFCNNAGPSFIFGICGSFFSTAYIPLLIWMIQIFSALITGIITARESNSKAVHAEKNEYNLTSAVTSSIKAMGQICGWIILFRVVMTFLQKWILWILPKHLQILAFGILEITNGCCTLAELSDNSVRFILCSIMLAFGGLCVTAQTHAVTPGLPIGTYIRGKLLQTTVCFILSISICAAFPICQVNAVAVMTILLILIASVFLLYQMKKAIAFSGNMMYNKRKLCKKR